MIDTDVECVALFSVMQIFVYTHEYVALGIRLKFGLRSLHVRSKPKALTANPTGYLEYQRACHVGVCSR